MAILDCHDSCENVSGIFGMKGLAEVGSPSNSVGWWVDFRFFGVLCEGKWKRNGVKTVFLIFL